MPSRHANSIKRTTVRRAERLEARVTAEQRALIEQAAALEGRSVTAFVRGSVQEAAKRAIAEREMVQISIQNLKFFIDALLSPREPPSPGRSG